MKNFILLMIFTSVSLLYGQQTDGLKVEKTSKTSIMERRIAKGANDSIVKNNLNDILRQKDNSSSIFGKATQYNSDVQTNVNRLQDNVHSFNNTFNRMMPQGQGIEIKKRK